MNPNEPSVATYLGRTFYALSLHGTTHEVLRTRSISNADDI